jgi:hypothetical protein
MSLIENFEVGQKVMARIGFGFQEVEIAEVDDHPFEYARLRVILINSPALPSPEVWISSREVEGAR